MKTSRRNPKKEKSTNPIRKKEFLLPAKNKRYLSGHHLNVEINKEAIGKDYNGERCAEECYSGVYVDKIINLPGLFSNRDDYLQLGDNLIIDKDSPIEIGDYLIYGRHIGDNAEKGPTRLGILKNIKGQKLLIENPNNLTTEVDRIHLKYAYKVLGRVDIKYY